MLYLSEIVRHRNIDWEHVSCMAIAAQYIVVDPCLGMIVEESLVHTTYIPGRSHSSVTNHSVCFIELKIHNSLVAFDLVNTLMLILNTPTCVGTSHTKAPEGSQTANRDTCL